MYAITLPHTLGIDVISSTPDIFLSYSRDDRATASLFAEGFERAGFSVWWDVTLKSGEDYDQATEQALRGAKAVVVLWSVKSAASRWVRTEATIALQSKTLVPVMIESCQRPIMFELTQTAELGHWRGDGDDNAWLAFLNDVQRFVHRAAGLAAIATTPGREDVQKALANVSTLRPELKAQPGPAPAAVKPTAQAHPRQHQPWWLRVLPLVGALVVGGLVAGISLRQPPQAGLPINRFQHAMPAETAFRNTGRNVLAVSPNGRHFVYNTLQGLMLRDMSEVGAQVIPGTEETLSNPFFAPDGRAVAYYAFANRQLKRIGLEGGAAVAIATIKDNPVGASWATNNTIYYGQDDGIYHVGAGGGTPELVIASQTGERVASPELLPDSDTLLFTTTTGTWEAADIVAQSLSTGKRTVLVSGGNDPHYLPTGHLVYAVGADLFAVAFDARSLAVSGERVPLVQGIAHAILTASSNYGIASDGTLVYLTGTVANQQHNLLWVGRDGVETAIPIAPAAYSSFQLSPDGKRVVLNEDPQDDNWIWDFATHTRTLLNLDGGRADNPIWTADSARIVFASAASRTMDMRAANNVGTITTLVESSRMAKASADAQAEPLFLSPDGRQLIFSSFNSTTLNDIGMFTIGDAAAPTWLLRSRAVEADAALSPDGRWMAYRSNESGRNEIYVRPFPKVDDDLIQVSNSGGTSPQWSRDGKELFYVALGDYGKGQLVSTAVTTKNDKFSFGARTSLMAWPYVIAPIRSYDVSPDGQRFLVLRNTIDTAAADGSKQAVIITQHWTDELKRLVPAQ
jgi:eukaryotic-like serine/threonine-protein kinase